jgi:DNA repair exonuclease SbcCD nuclease subunit
VKLAHLADLHLGFRQYHRQTPAGLNQREADVAGAFERAVDTVLAERPAVVVIAGDAFHSVRPTNTAILFAYQQLRRIREALPEAPIILIAGNHDSPRSVETGSILRLFESIGVDVAIDQPRRLTYPRLDLSVYAVPHPALLAAERPVLRPEGPERFQLLVLHGEVEGVFPVDRSGAEFGGALLRREELQSGNWSYVALGHYHVQHQVAPRIWYCGALEYVSPNPWGELKEEAAHRQPGKAWLLADLATGAVERKPVPLARRVIDLEPLDGTGQAAEALDEMVAARVAAVPGGIGGQVVRLVIRNLPRHVARRMNYTAIRGYALQALHFHLDIRPPKTNRTVGMGAPGQRLTLAERVRAYLEGRSLPADVSRQALVTAGVELIEAVERERQES